MSTFPLLMSLADELDNLTTRSYLDDFGLGFYPHRHYHRVPSLSLPSEEEWAEQQQYQQRRNSRSRKYSEPIKENQLLEQQYELQSVTTIGTTKKIFNTIKDIKKDDNSVIITSEKLKIDGNTSASNNVDDLHILDRELNTNRDNIDEKQDYDGYISKHTSSNSINNKYEFPKTQSESNKLVKNFKVKKLNLQSSLPFNISKKKEKQQLKKSKMQQSSLEQLDNEEENSSNISPEDGPNEPNK